MGRRLPLDAYPETSPAPGSQLHAVQERKGHVPCSAVGIGEFFRTNESLENLIRIVEVEMEKVQGEIARIAVKTENES